MDLETLLAERAIYRRLAEFSRAMDNRDWAALIDLTTDDITAELGTGPIQGRDHLVQYLRSFLDDCGPTQHLLGNVLIDVQGDTATSCAYVSDMHVGTGERSQQTFQTLGDYHDQWRRIDGVWRLRHRTKHNRGHIGSYEVLGPGPKGWRS